MNDIRIIRTLSILIMVGAASASYVTQRGLFVGPWRVDSYTASIAPVAVDLLAVICALALHRVGYGKVLPATVLVLTGGASITANWIAGETVGSKCVHSGMVGLYLLAEMVASQKAKRAAKAETAAVMVQAKEFGAVRAATSELVADEANSPNLPEAPTSPAPGRVYSERHDRRLRRGK